MSMAMGFGPMMIVFLLGIFGKGGTPDLLGVIDPRAGLEALGQGTDAAALAKILAGDFAPQAPAAGQYDKAEAEKAIQNLASSSEAIRARARDKLASLGGAVKARLEEVVEKDKRRAEEAKKVIESLAAVEKSASERGGLLQTLAVRLAAEQGLKDLLPAVQKLTESKDRFLASAARESVATLDPTAGTTAVAETPYAVPPEVEALSSETRFLIAYEGPRGQGQGGAPLRIGQVLAAMMAMVPFGAPPGGAGEIERQVTQGILQFVESYGNLRPQAAYVANVGGVGPQGGGLGIVVLGDYEPEKLVKGCTSLQGPNAWVLSELAGGRKKLTYRGDTHLVLLGDHAVLFLPEEGSKFFPLEEYLAALGEKKKTLRGSARWDKFLGTLGGSAVVRGLAITDETLMSEILKEAENDAPPPVTTGLKGLKEVELDLTLAEGEVIRFRAEGAFKDSESADSLTGFIKDSIQEGIQGLEGSGMADQVPPLKALLEAMKGIKVSSEGKQGILRGALPAKALLLGAMTTGFRVEQGAVGK